MKSSEDPAGRSLTRLPSNISLDSSTDELRNTNASGRSLHTAALHCKKWRLYGGHRPLRLDQSHKRRPQGPTPPNPQFHPQFTPSTLAVEFSPCHGFASGYGELLVCEYTLANFDNRPTHHPCRTLAQVSYININFHIINGLRRRPRASKIRKCCLLHSKMSNHTAQIS